MEITETGREELVAHLEVTIQEADYRETFDETLRSYRKQMNLPGFRKGQVPKSLVKKQYGKAILFNDVSEQAMKAVNAYIDEQNLKVFGMPLLVETDLGEKNPIDKQDYSLKFDVGLVPEVELDLSDLPEIKRYEVTIEEEDVERVLQLQRYRNGERVPAEEVTADDVFEIKGEFFEVDENGQEVKDGVQITLDFLTKYYPEFQAKLAGKKAGDEIPTNFTEFFASDATARNVLKITEEGYEELKQKPLHFRVMELKKVEPAPLNEDLFNKLLGEPGEGETRTEEQARQKLHEELERVYNERAQVKYRVDLQNALLEKADFELPREHVERLLITQMEDINSVQELQKQQPNYLMDFKLYLVHSLLKKQHPEVEVQEEDLKESVREQWRNMLGQQSAFATETPEAETETAAATEIVEEGAEEDSPETTVEEVVGEEDETAAEQPREPTEKVTASEESADEDQTEAEGAMEPPNQEALLEHMVNYSLQDENQRRERENQLQAEKIFQFLEERATVTQQTIDKETFDELYGN